MPWCLLKHQRRQCEEGFDHLLCNHCSPAHNNNNEGKVDDEEEDNVDDEDKASICCGAYVAMIHINIIMTMTEVIMMTAMIRGDFRNLSHRIRQLKGGSERLSSLPFLSSLGGSYTPLIKITLIGAIWSHYEF